MSTNNLNPGNFEAELSSTALAAARVGTTNNAILRLESFSEDGSGSALDYTDSAEDGSTLEVLKPGLYFVKASAENGGAVPIALALTQNTDTAGLTATPTVALVGLEEFASYAGDDAAGNAGPVQFSCMVRVKNSDIAAGRAAGGTGSRLRLHCKTSAGNAPSGLTVASFRTSITRISN